MPTELRKRQYRADGFVPATLAGEAFRCDPYHSKFWHRVSAGNWEPETFRVLSGHLDRDTDYLDIGAWIGPTVLFGARKARHVWCFEPDPRAFRHLAWNIELNRLDNVSALPVALAPSTGIARMASFGGETGDSMTSLLNAAGSGGFPAVTLAWDLFAQEVDLSPVGLVKMDVEGAEFDLLPALAPFLKKHRPALYLSTHAPYLPADARAGAMARLADVLSFYRRCTDERGDVVTGEALVAPAAISGFRSFLFST